MSEQSQHQSSQFKTEKPWLGLRYHDSSRTSIKKPNELENEMEEPPLDLIDNKILDQIQGSMMGMTLGDALGAHVEFRPRQYMVQNPVTDLEGGGTWGLQKGQFTDDTSMALCLANSLVAQSKFNPYDQLVRYKWWYKKGYMSSTGECFDIGAATSQSLNEFERRQNLFAEQYDVPAEHIDYFSDEKLLDQFNVYCSEDQVAGNGALMRLAPVPLFFFRSAQHAVEYSGRSGQITHGDRKAYDACRYYGALIVAALYGYKKEELLDKQFYLKHKQWFSGKPLCAEIRLIAEGSYQKKGGYKDGIRGKGYIVNALEAALWAFWSDNDSFETGALAAVNLGDDTDTTAAIYGQLAGAYYGYKKLPRHWIKHVYAKKFILNLSKWIAYEGQIWQPSESISSFLPTSPFQPFSHETTTKTFSSKPTANVHTLQNGAPIPVLTSLEYHGESQTERTPHRPSLRATASEASQTYSFSIEPSTINREPFPHNHTDSHFVSASSSGGMNMKSSLKNSKSKKPSSMIQTSIFPSALVQYDETTPVRSNLYGPVLRASHPVSCMERSDASRTRIKSQELSTHNDKLLQSTSKTSPQATCVKNHLAKTNSDNYSSQNTSSVPSPGIAETSSIMSPKRSNSKSRHRLSDIFHNRKGSHSPTPLTQAASVVVNGSHRSEIPINNTAYLKTIRNHVTNIPTNPSPNNLSSSTHPSHKEKSPTKADEMKSDIQFPTKITKTGNYYRQNSNLRDNKDFI